MAELTEREKTIVELINNLAEVSDDETTTQEAIDSMMARIRQSTSENIRQEMEKAEEDVAKNKMEFPAKELTNSVKSSIDEEREKMMREFMSEAGHAVHQQPLPQMLFSRIREVKQPCRAHSTDAGIDFFVPDEKAWTDEYKSMIRSYSKNPNHQDLVFIGVNGVEVAPGAHVAIPSGIKTIIPQGYGMMMVNKSGVATKLKLDHSACLIDSEYRDELIFCFFNHNVEPVKIEPGMKITQGLIVPILNLPMVEVLNCVYDDLAKQGNRGGGFGSTGVK